MFSRFTGFSNMFTPGARNPNNQAGQGSPAHNNLHHHRVPGPSRSANSSPAPSPKKPCHHSPQQGDGVKMKDLSQTCEISVDNSSAVIAKIATLYAERLMSDITLIINQRSYLSHRLILCASSDVFQVMLMNPSWTESKESRIVLQESTECAESFENFLKYLYTGQIKLELLNVMHLLTLADKYNVKDLISLCLEYMSNHIPAAASNNQLIHWYQHTSNCGHQKVAECCRNFIKWNFEEVAKAEDFLYLDLDLLTSMLLDDDLVVFDEFTLYQCIDYWVCCQRSKFLPNDPQIEEKMEHIVKLSMDCIRFPMMSSRQIAEMLLSPLTQKYKDQLMEKMTTGMAFHTGAEEQMFETIAKHPCRSKLFTPRLYSTEKFGVCLSIDNFRTIQHYNSKTLVFSTPLSFSENRAEKQMEWVVDLYPKGVFYNKSLLIVWQGTVVTPEYSIKTVRLSVLCKSDEEADVRVQIGILIAGYLDGIEHVRTVVRKNHIFSGRDKILNIDDLLPYGELTRCATCSVNSSPNANVDARLAKQGRDCQCSSKSNYLVGEGHDSLKIRIVITPMSEYNIN